MNFQLNLHRETVDTLPVNKQWNWARMQYKCSGIFNWTGWSSIEL